MLRKILTSVLVVTFLAVIPAMVGCEKDEIKTHRQVEVHDKVVGQHEVVE